MFLIPFDSKNPHKNKPLGLFLSSSNILKKDIFPTGGWFVSFLPGI